MLIERIWAANPGRNYHYLIACDATHEALAVDPLNAAAVLERANALGWSIRQVFNTHEHPDHTGGNAAVVAATGARTLAHAAAVARIGGISQGLRGGDTVRVGSSVTLQCLDTPGHTLAHLCLFEKGDARRAPALFSGDTLFNAGAGNCLHGGEPGLLFDSFSRVIAHLPDTTRIFPGHDYLLRNLAFTLDREPDNDAARELAQQCAGTDGADMPVLTLAEERRINLFLRLDSATILAGLRAKGALADGKSSSREVFLALRELRNRW